MEVHPAYAVVLDEEGRFLKAANLRYQVGDTVRDIVELRRPRGQRLALWKPLSGVAGLAACLCIVFFGYYQPNFVPYGALRIQINPDVELTLSRTDRVLELEGLNEDGQSLIAGYEYSGKDREDVTGELVERAIDMGYLSGGETVSITVTSADADWQAREEQAAREDLEERYGETIVIQIGPAPEEEPATEVVIPVAPPAPRRPPPRTSRRSLCRRPRRRPPRPLSPLPTRGSRTTMTRTTAPTPTGSPIMRIRITVLTATASPTMNLPTTALMWTVTPTMRTGMTAMTGTTMTTTGTAMTMMMATMTESGMTRINAEKFPPRPRFWRPAAVSSLCQPKKRKKVFPRPRFFGSGSVI